MSSKILLLILFILATSCATVKVPDIEVCVDMGEKAFCSTSLSKKTREIPAAEWSRLRRGRLTMSHNGWGELEKTIRKMCKAAGKRCVKDVKATVKNLQSMKKRAMKNAINK